MSRGTRIPFLLKDLEREIRSIAPQTGTFDVVLHPGTHRPVMEELSSHFGNPAIAKADEFNIGAVVIRRGRLSN